MTVYILLHLLIVLGVLIFNSMTVYHFYRYRYEGDSSKIIVIFFIILFIILTVLPFFFFDYSMQEQSILERLIR